MAGLLEQAQVERFKGQEIAGIQGLTDRDLLRRGPGLVLPIVVESEVNLTAVSDGHVCIVQESAARAHRSGCKSSK